MWVWVTGVVWEKEDGGAPEGRLGVARGQGWRPGDPASTCPDSETVWEVPPRGSLSIFTSTVWLNPHLYLCLRKGRLYLMAMCAFEEGRPWACPGTHSWWMAGGARDPRPGLPGRALSALPPKLEDSFGSFLPQALLLPGLGEAELEAIIRALGPRQPEDKSTSRTWVINTEGGMGLQLHTHFPQRRAFPCMAVLAPLSA